MSNIGEILFVIPARGGSKRLPRKNVLPLAGKPLICWTIEAALKAKLDARIMVTSDDDEILEIARRYESQGVTAYKRPDELATDTSSTIDVVIDSVKAERAAGHDPRTLMLLQPTSPLRSADDIRAALEVFRKRGCEDAVVTVCEVDHPTAWVGTVTSESLFTGVSGTSKRSQDYEKEYRLNGAVYVVNVTTLLTDKKIFSTRTLASKMPRSRSLDVDEYLDLQICEALLADMLKRERVDD